MSKQKDILDAALKLFVESGFHGTPTSKIAKEAGVANGTLFHYYKTKDELILALYSDIKTRMTDYIYSNVKQDQSFKNQVRTVYVNTLEWVFENQLEFDFTQQFTNSPFLNLISSEEITKQSKSHLDMVRVGVENKTFKNIPVELLFNLINNQVYGVSQYLNSEGFSADKRKAVINNCFELLWDMIT